jgi:hypothetical protein
MSGLIFRWGVLVARSIPIDKYCDLSRELRELYWPELCFA